MSVWFLNFLGLATSWIVLSWGKIKIKIKNKKEAKKKRKKNLLTSSTELHLPRKCYQRNVWRATWGPREHDRMVVIIEALDRHFRGQAFKPMRELTLIKKYSWILFLLCRVFGSPRVKFTIKLITFAWLNPSN